MGNGVLFLFTRKEKEPKRKAKFDAILASGKKNFIPLHKTPRRSNTAGELVSLEKEGLRCGFLFEIVQIHQEALFHGSGNVSGTFSHPVFGKVG